MSRGCVLSVHPLTASFRERLEARFSVADYLVLSALERRGKWQALKQILALKGRTVLIPTDSAGGNPYQQLLLAFAAVTRASAVSLIDHELRSTEVPRSRMVASAWNFFSASVLGCARALGCLLELELLVRRPRIHCPERDWGRVLYIKSNQFLGAKAGGALGHVAGVVNSLLGRGIAVDYASMEQGLLLEESVRQILVPPPSIGVPPDVNLYRSHAAFVRQLKGERPTHVYQRMSMGNYAGVVLSRSLQVPLVLEYNGSEVWIQKKWMSHRDLGFTRVAVRAEEACLRHAHLVVTVSEVLRDELEQRGVDPDRIVVYPNGVDPTRYHPERVSKADQIQLRTTLDIPKEAPVIGFVGTFGPWHGVEVLAEAARQMAPRHPGVVFLFVGDGAGMPAVRELLAQIPPTSYRLTGIVPQHECEKYLAISDVLVSPHVPNADGTRFFGSPTKLFEYMAMGKAVLASDLEQIGLVLRPALRCHELPQEPPEPGSNHRAVLSNPGSVEEVISGLEFLLEHPEWRASLGQSARRAVLECFTWEHHVNAILEGYSRS